ncbi:MAG: bifunctional adenosylcobinamide kinase/adenosylcobinamide-phosphate guanylyltransferase [Clostridia bacterium]|nr:bifunctional adenosylcobinamide kinase/adenosylcobinamide-phosphate guanylyltransferase [Clostridia bacterium]
MPITLILGGARSGKSTFAEKLAGKLSDNVAYIATGQAFDEEMAHRIALHKQSRPAHWSTYEEPLNIAALIQKIINRHDVLLLDCLTLLISNILLKDQNINNLTSEILNEKEKQIINQFEKIISEIKNEKVNLIIVSNEIGLGLVPGDPLSRGYRDIVGRTNQFLAKHADQVITVWAGIPLQIKPDLERIVVND